MFRFLSLILKLNLIFFFSTAQVLTDTLFNPQISDPTYQLNEGPTIYIDAAHNNYHTASGRFAPFAKVLSHEGFRVRENFLSLDSSVLKSMNTIVISNAIHPANENNWIKPVHSAFSESEIMHIRNWVAEGGRLFLLADHMPFGGAAQKLAEAFGFNLCDCFAMDKRKRNNEFFFRSEGSLIASEITDGLSKTQFTDSIITFTGSAFKIPDDAIPILKLIDYEIFSPDTAWQFGENTQSENSLNYYQGAARNYGKGKIVLMGEAAMFTAQISGDYKAGMNSPFAKSNLRLLRNIMQWLVN